MNASVSPRVKGGNNERGKPGNVRRGTQKLFDVTWAAVPAEHHLRRKENTVVFSFFSFFFFNSFPPHHPSGTNYISIEEDRLIFSRENARAGFPNKTSELDAAHVSRASDDDGATRGS